MKNSLFFSQILFFLAVCMISMSASAVIGNELSFGRLAKDLKNKKVEIKFFMNKDMDFGDSKWVYIVKGEVKDDLDKATETKGDYCKLFIKKKHKDHSSLITAGDVPPLFIEKIKIGSDHKHGFLSPLPVYIFSFKKNSFFKKLVCHQYDYKRGSDGALEPVHSKKENLDYLLRILGDKGAHFRIEVFTLTFKLEPKVLYENNDKAPSMTYPDLENNIPPFNPLSTGSTDE